MYYYYFTNNTKFSMASTMASTERAIGADRRARRDARSISRFFSNATMHDFDESKERGSYNTKFSTSMSSEDPEISRITRITFFTW